MMKKAYMILAALAAAATLLAAKPLDYEVTSVTLAWENPVGAVSNRLYWGTSSGVYSQHKTIPAAVQGTVPLTAATNWYIAVTAISAEGVESDYSNEVLHAAVRPTTPKNLRRL
jgi:hypothetical protein